MQSVGLHQNSIEFHRLQQLAQGLDFATGVGGIGGLGDRHAQRLGIEAHLSDELRCAGVGFGDRAPQRLAVTDQRVQLGNAGLGRHPVTQQALKASHVQLGQQQPERGIRGRLAEIGAEQLVEGLAMPFGKTLHPDQGALTAQDREDRHQQHPPLRETDTTPHPAVWKRLEETDQIACCSRRGGGLGEQESGAVPAKASAGATAGPALLGQTSNRPWAQHPLLTSTGGGLDQTPPPENGVNAATLLMAA